MIPGRAQVPTLTDGTVTLRRHGEDDVDLVLEQCRDPETVRWTTVPTPYSLDDAKRFVREVVPGGWETGAEWGFAVEVDGRYGGTVLLRPSPDGVGEIAFAAHPSIRGTGAMRRAVLLLVDWAFAQGIGSIVWWAHVGNWASRKLVASVGFAVEGTVRRHLGQRGELRDGWVATLLPDDPRDFRTPWLEVPRLADDVVVLREMTEADLPRVVEACSDERSRRWLGRLPSPYTIETGLAFLETQRERRATGTGVQWAIADPVDDGLLGTISLFDHVRGVEAEVGYWAHPDARGRGVMTHAVPLVTAYAFDGLGVAKVKAGAATGNVASLHVIEACGFRRYGVERLGTEVLAGRADLALYDLLAEEWRERR